MTHKPQFNQTGSVAASSANSGTNTGDQTFSNTAGEGMVENFSSVVLGRDSYYTANLYAHGASFFSTLSGLNGLIVGASIVPKRTATFNKIMCRISVGVAAGKARIGVYEEVSASDPRPNSLIIGSAEIDATSSNDYTETLGASYTLTAGKRYWLVGHTNSNTIQFLSIVPNALSGPFGSKGPAGTDVYTQYAVQGSQAYAALPATFPTVTIVGAAEQPSVPMVGIAFNS